MSQSYEELEASVVKAIEAKTPQTPQFQDAANPMFAESIVPNKTLIGLGIGGGISGIAGGFVQRFSPIDLDGYGIQGVVPIVAGTILKLTVAKKGIAEDVANGMIVAGISEAVSGLTGRLGVAQKREKTPEKNTSQTNRGVNAIW